MDLPTYSAEEFDEHELKHYGILRKSGRYPWGSGGTNVSRAKTFLDMVADLESQGLSRADIARGLGLDSTTQLRDTVTIANNARRRDNQLKAEKLRAKGWSATAIGREMGLNESSVRQLLNEQAQQRAQVLENTVNMLRSEVDRGGWIDIGSGTEYYIPGGGISKEKLRAAVSILKDEGYKQIDVQVDQTGVGGNKKTTVKTLCPPETTYKDVVTSKDQIRSIAHITDDGGETFKRNGDLPPLQVDPKRVAILYKEDGGEKVDGVVYVRPGVEDVSIGGSNYAQVRIDVGGSHYIKGMAMYKDDLPAGVDLLVGSNKKRGTPMMGEKDNTVLKNKSDDPDMPFGANINRQITKMVNGKEQVTSALNIISEEGTWDGWSRELSSQVLSKQSPKLAKQLLDRTYDKKKREFDEIMALTNPTVREKLLQSFSDSADSDAVHLSAAGMKRSSYHVILPFNSLKDTEIYAPNYNQGETVALIRYPHGGTFEIPILKVNNNARAPKAAIGRAVDAVGINHEVAKRLSGADFDGDFVMVIPNDGPLSIKSTPALKSLESFDPQSFKLPEEAPRMSARTKGKQMGDVSNLITDMTIQKAPTDEIVRAVKHSMVVIDAEKHHLDYKRSAIEHGIPALKEKYQGGAKRGAATLISRATSQERVNARRKPRVSLGEGPHIDPATGKLRWVDTGEMKTTRRVLKDGTVRTKQEPVKILSTKLAETDDARTLMSANGGTLIERIYAEHSNKLKALANTSRKEMVTNTKPIPVSNSAKKVYHEEVKQLKADLDIALMNSPRERAAQVLANAIIQQKRQANPEMDSATLKKESNRALKEARHRVGASKTKVPISDRQWEAIQAGAVSKTMLGKILDNADLDRVKELATPKPKVLMDNATTARAKSLAAQGLTQAEIARVLGMSLTTLKKGLADG